MTDLTPHEEGLLHGLADKWGSNPYEQGRTTINHDYESYIQGRSIGLELREIATERLNRYTKAVGR